MKFRIKLFVMPLVGLLILPFFQNCGQVGPVVNSGINSESSDSSFLPDNAGALPGGGGARNIQTKTCTSDPVLLISANQYLTNAFGALTVPVLVTFDTSTKNSKADFPRSHYLFPSTSNPGNGQGLYGYDLSVAYDKFAQPHFIGRESYAVRTRNCYFKSYAWQSMTGFEEVLLNSESQLSTEDMVPYTIVSTVVFDSQVYSAINFIGTDDNSACSQTSSTYKPTVPAIYNHTTKAVSFLQINNSPDIVNDLIVEGNKLIAIGTTRAGTPVVWKDEQRFELPMENVGYYDFNVSLGNYFFAGLKLSIDKNFLNVWKNSTLKNSVQIASRASLVGFDADLNNTHALIKENDTSRLYYLINEKEEVTVDTSAFVGCTGIDVKSFNNKVYVLGVCTAQDKSQKFVIWIDGILTEMTYTGKIQNVSTTRFNVGCYTADGFYTDLDNDN